jgi:hypothetical protein
LRRVIVGEDLRVEVCELSSLGLGESLSAGRRKRRNSIDRSDRLRMGEIDGWRRRR